MAKTTGAAGATSGRVLQSFEHEGVAYRANDLFEGDDKTVAAFHDSGHVDAHPDAVAHAEENGARRPGREKAEAEAKDKK